MQAMEWEIHLSSGDRYQSADDRRGGRKESAAGRGQAANVIFESSRLPPMAFGLRAPLGGDW